MTNQDENIKEKYSYYSDNPFYSNYVFTQNDIKRSIFKPNFIQKVILFFKPTYVQVNEGYAWFYKIHNNQYYFIREEKLS